jgi:hypothetical protein
MKTRKEGIKMRKRKMIKLVVGFYMLLFGVLPAHATHMDSLVQYFSASMEYGVLLDSKFGAYHESRGFCGLTRISGKFDESERNIYLDFYRIPNGSHGLWIVKGSHGSNNSYDINVYTECVDYERFDRYKGDALVHMPDIVVAQRPRVYIPERLQSPQNVKLWGNDSICYLRGVSGVFDGAGEFSWILAHESKEETPDPSVNWMRVVSNSWDGCVSGRPMCVAIQPGLYQPVSIHDVKQGQPDERMIPADEGVCFLSGMSGKFRGGGEEIGIYVDDQGWRTLYVRSNQEDVRAKAVCVRYSD